MSASSYWRSILYWLSPSSPLYDSVPPAVTCSPDDHDTLAKHGSSSACASAPATEGGEKTTGHADDGTAGMPPPPRDRPSLRVSTSSSLASYASFSPVILVPGAVNTPLMFFGPPLPSPTPKYGRRKSHLPRSSSESSESSTTSRSMSGSEEEVMMRETAIGNDVLAEDALTITKFG